jgi:hypothetical protein
MSEIILARRLVVDVLKFGEMDLPSKIRLERALELMVREPACRRATPHTVRITAAMRADIHHLADTTNLTMHEISERVGVHNIGRVSEVLTGKR